MFFGIQKYTRIMLEPLRWQILKPTTVQLYIFIQCGKATLALIELMLVGREHFGSRAFALIPIKSVIVLRFATIACSLSLHIFRISFGLSLCHLGAVPVLPSPSGRHASGVYASRSNGKPKWIGLAQNLPLHHQVHHRRPVRTNRPDHLRTLLLTLDLTWKHCTFATSFLLIKQNYWPKKPLRLGRLGLNT